MYPQFVSRNSWQRRGASDSDLAFTSCKDVNVNVRGRGRIEVVHNRFRRVCACMPDIVVRGILHTVSLRQLVPLPHVVDSYCLVEREYRNRPRHVFVSLFEISAIFYFQ